MASDDAYNKPSFDYSHMILPPHWRSEEIEDEIFYVNDLTEETTTQHPFERYLEIIQIQIESGHVDNHINDDTMGISELNIDPVASSPAFSPQGTFSVSKSAEDNEDRRVDEQHLSRPVSKVKIRDFNDNSLASASTESRGLDAGDLEGITADENEFGLATPMRQATPMNGMQDRGRSNHSGKKSVYEYHCQWKERNIFGHTSIYGLTLRFNPDDGSTLVKFDGVREGEWTFTSLQGPCGVLEMHDLFIGAKIEVFGRHLTISTANGPAARWIHSESKRLMKMQNAFRARIESVGHKPVVPKPEIQAVKNIMRDTKTSSMANLRKMSMDCAKLGEQVAQLGLAQMAVF